MRSGSTSSSGVATTSYVGNGVAGTDTVIAWADVDGDSKRDLSEPFRGRDQDFGRPRCSVRS